MSLEAKILEMALEEGCSLAGIAPAEPLLAAREHLLKRQKKGPGLPFSGKDILARTDPSLLLPEVKSILALSFDYRTPPPGNKPADTPRGRWSRFARVRDYHQVVGHKMARICARITALKPGAACKAYVDTGPLLDRAIASRAGLGFFGKNNCLLNEKLGSFTFLGEILLDFPLEPGSENTGPGGCHRCRRCLDACPTAALTSPYCLDHSRCLSYLSQASEYIHPGLRPYMADRLYGCDLCQEACPYNQEKREEIDEDFLPLQDPYPPLLPLLDLSKKDFAARYQESPIFWRGRSVLQRNAIIALGNMKAREAEPRLGRLLLEDPRPTIRGYSAWALGETGGSPGFRFLARAVEREKEPYVLQEITDALYRHQKANSL